MTRPRMPNDCAPKRFMTARDTSCDMPKRFKGGDPEVGRLTALAKPFARQQGPAPPGRRPDGPSAREAVSFFNVIPTRAQQFLPVPNA
jgi:hypothetical protein